MAGILHPENSQGITIESFKRKAPTKPVRLTKTLAQQRFTRKNSIQRFFNVV